MWPLDAPDVRPPRDRARDEHRHRQRTDQQLGSVGIHRLDPVGFGPSGRGQPTRTGGAGDVGRGRNRAVGDCRGQEDQQARRGAGAQPGDDELRGRAEAHATAMASTSGTLATTTSTVHPGWARRPAKSSTGADQSTSTPSPTQVTKRSVPQRPGPASAPRQGGQHDQQHHDLDQDARRGRPASTDARPTSEHTAPGSVSTARAQLAA